MTARRWEEEGSLSKPENTRPTRVRKDGVVGAVKCLSDRCSIPLTGTEVAVRNQSLEGNLAPEMPHLRRIPSWSLDNG